MHLWTIDELMLMTRDELFRLAAGIEQGLDVLETGSLARHYALT
ncbi:MULTISPECIES: hypothetical protein [unclassified Bradyrhizobium]|nr:MULTISPECIES: hypothetical protein [unclassified Bradyrhizobium]